MKGFINKHKLRGKKAATLLPTAKDAASTLISKIYITAAFVNAGG